jgi:hypothetical protein
MLLPNGSAIKLDVIESFNKAVINPENINSSGGLNWDFVDADINIEVGDFYTSEYLYECIAVLVDNYYA